MSCDVYQLPGSTKTICIIVGLGLVGRAISEQFSLHCRAVYSVEQKVNDWKSADNLIAALKMRIVDSGASHIELIWCAGKAGFTACDEEMVEEYNFFKSTISSVKRVSDIGLTVNFVSSAGGIYELSNVVSSIDSVNPARPYGTWKLKQEIALSNMCVSSRIYRASSVYGLSIKNARTGLIGAILKSANYRRPITIYANQNTLRDYIYNVDLAKLITSDIINQACLGVRIAASGRATSITTLLRMIENITMSRVSATYRSNQTNEQDIVFSNNVIDKAMRVTPLEESLRLINRQMRLAM